ncbi:MAG: ATP-binding protein [Candidatus Eisenbacteria bacterium]|uniref:ATP-binding protein n=1 Tax=Eiseniibacteriota bacterium TaxID=2212470 RepID=A0A933SJH7_UNCEI|nr:ATP-binding protein [Candidatus Eisenbacteria bacterium]
MSVLLPKDSNAPRAFTFSTDSRLGNVELLARAVRGLVSAAGMPGRECAHVELALVEAVNNVVRHAYHGEPGHRVEVTATVDGASLVLEVADEGTPMPPHGTPVLDFDPDDLASLPEGGMGLYLIHSVMDSVEYHSRDGRNVLVMTHRIAEAA